MEDDNVTILFMCATDVAKAAAILTYNKISYRPSMCGNYALVVPSIVVNSAITKLVINNIPCELEGVNK